MIVTAACPRIVLANSALSLTSIVPQQSASFYPSLEDLSALLPEEVLLPQPTLCKVTTEQDRSAELGRNSNDSVGPEAAGDSPIFEVHLRVLLRDFRSTSTVHFEVNAKRLLLRIIVLLRWGSFLSWLMWTCNALTAVLTPYV